MMLIIYQRNVILLLLFLLLHLGLHPVPHLVTELLQAVDQLHLLTLLLDQPLHTAKAEVVVAGVAVIPAIDI